MTNWRPVKRDMEKNTSANPEIRELVEVLEEPLGQGAIGAFAKKIYTSGNYHQFILVL